MLSFASPSPSRPRSPTSGGRTAGGSPRPASPERTLLDAVHHRQRGGDEPWRWLGRAKRCHASGPNLSAVDAGETGSVLLHAHAALPANYRNVRTYANAQVLPRDAGPAALPVSEAEVLFEEWQAARVPLSFGPLYNAGEYLLAITVEGGHISGSPFALRVRAGAPVAAASELVGSDDGGPHGRHVSSAVAGLPSSFTLLARDRFGNRVERGGDRVAVRFDARVDTLSDAHARGRADARVECDVLDHGNGAYSVRYTADRAGAYDASVTLDGTLVGGEPMLCLVVSSTTLPFASTAEELASLRPAAGEHVSFAVKARDANGNQRERGGDDFVARVVRRRSEGEAAEEGDEVLAAVYDDGDGTYRVGFTPRRAGVYDVHILAGGAHAIRGSPFELSVTPGRLEPEASGAYGGALDECVAGEMNTLYIAPADAEGNWKPAEDVVGELEVHVTDEHGAPDPSARVYARAEAERIHCQVVPSAAGTALVHVSLGGRAVQGSPFRVHVRAGPPSAAKSLLQHAAWRAVAGEPQTWVIEACDKGGNRCERGGARAELVAVPADGGGGEVASVEAVDRDDGTYALTWSCERAGVWSIHAQLDGDVVGGAPARVLVEPGRASARRTAAEDGTRLAGETLLANEWVAFLVIARDAHGNPTRRGGDEFAAACSASSEAVLLHDWGDGRYELRFCPRALGAHSVRVSMPAAGGDIVGSPFEFVVAPGPASARHSAAHGAGLEGVGLLGGVGAFTIVARDTLGNRLTYGGHPFAVSVVPRSHGHYGNVHTFEDRGDGSYGVEYTTPVTGKYHIEVTLHSEHIAGSPFPVMISLAAPPNSPRNPLSPRHRQRAGSPPWPHSPETVRAHALWSETTPPRTHASTARHAARSYTSPRRTTSWEQHGRQASAQHTRTWTHTQAHTSGSGYQLYPPGQRGGRARPTSSRVDSAGAPASPAGARASRTSPVAASAAGLAYSPSPAAGAGAGGYTTVSSRCSGGGGGAQLSTP